jgi:hypothetical protein
LYAEWQKPGASASNSLPFLTHPRKSLFPPKSTISLKIDFLPVHHGLIGLKIVTIVITFTDYVKLKPAEESA